MTGSESEVLAIVHQFLVRYAADESAGGAHSLRRYQALFPGHEAAIAREFDALCGGEGGTARAAAPAPVLSEVGPYRLLEELGHGGQAVVYLAEDTRLGRKVALKLLSARRALTPDLLARFRHEAETASRLDHPGICTVYEAGELDGTPFLAMQLVDGESLAARIQRDAHRAPDQDSSGRRQAVADGVALVEQAARAVHAAHQAGIVHRDLKPANIMVTAEGRPVVLDFGLAYDDDRGHGLTLTGDLLGTPTYLPPERVQGAVRDSEPRTDVYGLGAILFECLTHRPPFAAPTRDGLYRAILTEPVPDARRRKPAVSADLQIVLETALEKDPARRYQSALDLADDLARVRAHEPIRARRLPAGLLLRRWAQRHPAVVATAGAAFVLLSAGLAVALVLLASRNVALRHALNLTLVGAAEQALNQDPTLAVLLARQALPDQGEATTEPVVSQLYRTTAVARQTAEFRDREASPILLGALWSEAAGRLITLSGPTGELSIWDVEGGTPPIRRQLDAWTRSVALHPDGRHFVTASCGASQTRSADCDRGRAVVWDLEGNRLHTLAHPTPLDYVSYSGIDEALALFSPEDDGALLLTGTKRGVVRLWDWRAEREVWSARIESDKPAISAVAWADDGEHFAAGTQDGTVRVWETTTHHAVELVGHSGPILDITFAHAGDRLATAAEDGTARLWARDGQLLQTLPDHGPRASTVEFSPDDQLLVTSAAMPPVAYLWRPGETQPPTILKGHLENVTVARFAPDGQTIATGSTDGTARLFDLDGDVRGVFRHDDMVTVARFSADGRTLLTAGWDGTARLWQLSHPRYPMLWFEPHPMRSVFSPDGRRLATTGPVGLAWITDLDTGMRRPIASHHGRRLVWNTAISPDGRHVATVCHDRTVQLSDVETGAKQWIETTPPFSAIDVAFSPDGAELAVAYTAGVALFEAASGGARGQLSAQIEATSVAYSHDGRWLAAGGRGFPAGGAVCLWQRGESTPHEWTAGEQTVSAVAFSPKDRLLAASARDGTLWLWDVATRTLHRPPWHGHERRANEIHFSPEGDRLLSASHDGTARLWNLKGRLLATLRAHTGPVNSAQFSPDGDRIATTSIDGSVRFWPARLEDLRALADERAFRGFTEAERATYAERLGAAAGNDRR